MKKVFKLGVSVCLMVTMLFMMAVQSYAGEKEILEGKVSIEYSKGSCTGSESSYTITTNGTIIGATTNNIKIYNETEKKAEILFNYDVTGSSSFSINSAPASTSGSFSQVVDGGSYISISVTAPQSSLFNTKTATLILTDITYAETASSADVKFEYDESLGKVTAGGEDISNESTITVGENGMNIAATPVEDAVFIGWIDKENSKIVSRDSEYMLNPVGNITVKALFRKKTSDTPYFMVDSAYIFDDLKKAVDTGDNIVLLCDGVLTGEYEIPAGATLLIPFDDVNTLYTNAPTGVSDGYTQPTRYRTLIMSSGANITVNGAISLSAKHFAANGGGINSGSPTGNVSFIEMKDNSSIVVNNGGKLYAWGYIIGSGSVIANSGAEIFENFQIMDFRGGTQTTSMKNGVFPLSQYYIQNIEVPLTINAGAKETTYTSVYMRKLISMDVVSSSVPFFGSSGAMFNLTSGYVTKRYDGTTDRLIVELNGDMSIAPMSMDFGISSINSANYELPVNSNITINVNSGNVLIKQDLCLLPGAEINVEKGATGTLNQGNSFYIYDADQWGTYCYSNHGDKPFGALSYAPGRTYTRTEANLVDAKIKVNGTLNAEGYAYTTQSGANIYSTENGIIKIMKPGVESYTYQLVQSAGSNTQIPITTAKLKNADGSYLEYDGIHTEFSYSNGAWGPKHDIVSHSAKAATCEEIGWNAYEECSLCDYSTYNEIATLGHNYVDYICTNCKKEKIATNTSYDISDNKITINSELIEEVPPTSLILIAIYDSSDKLLDSKLYYANALDAVTFDSESVNKIRVFSWEGFSTIEPLSMVEERLLQQ